MKTVYKNITKGPKVLFGNTVQPGETVAIFDEHVNAAKETARNKIKNACSGKARFFEVVSEQPKHEKGKK